MANPRLPPVPHAAFQNGRLSTGMLGTAAEMGGIQISKK